jgi:hypothetical protein
MNLEPPVHQAAEWANTARTDLHIVRFNSAIVGNTSKRMFSMAISAVTAPVPIKAPEVSAPKTPDVQNDAAADGTRTPQPTVLAPLPPGQGTRIDQLA